MNISLRLKDGGWQSIEEVEGVMAANEAFPYWLVRKKHVDEGKAVARFFAGEEVLEVLLIAELEDEERKLASVTPIRPENEFEGGDPFGSIS